MGDTRGVDNDRGPRERRCARNPPRSVRIPAVRECDGFVPGGTVRGILRVPGSKSIAQRAVVAAAFAHGTTELHGLPTSDDVVHALRAARAAGARFPSAARPDDLLATALLQRRGHGQLTGAPPERGASARPWCTAEVGESGTTARLATALLALARPAGSGAEVVPAGTLARRRSPALFRALRAAGAGVEHAAGREDGWPALLTSPGPVRQVVLEDPGSSQEVSALLLALAAWDGSATLEVRGSIPSAPYVALTVGVLERFGVAVERPPAPLTWPETALYHLGGPLRAPAEPLVIEPCASSAAVALAAACLTGGDATVPGLGGDSLQPDVAAVELFRAFGSEAERSVDGLRAAGRPSRPADVDLLATPDLAPVAAVLAADVALRGLGASVLRGLETLPGKESSRIEVLARGLSAVGLDCRATASSLEVRPLEQPSGSQLQPVELDPEGDHRMAFAFALLGLVRPGVGVLTPRCVAKSWPSFWADLTAAGARRR